MTQPNTGMEQWLPLFEILLNSPSAEGEAYFWLIEHQQQPHSPNFSSFLSLLLSPFPSPTSLPSSSSQCPRIWLQTLPYTLQARILSLLVFETRRFCPSLLQSLASHILNSDLPSSSDHPGFWVRRAARILLDDLTEPVHGPEHPIKEDEFDSLPHWLKDASKNSTLLLPWLPVHATQLRKADIFKPSKTTGCKELVSSTVKLKSLSESKAIDTSPPPLHPQIHEKAAALKSELLALDSTADTLHLADKLRKLCLDGGVGNELKVLGLIEPWMTNEETLSALLMNLSNDDNMFSKSWPAYVLCSVALPKLLCLESPASRVLLLSIICFCKKHQIAAVEALIFPLVLHKHGINAVVCDVLVRIIKECLHPSHVSAFCQRLLCGGGRGRRLVCLSCHQGLISEQIVWTESSFNLFQHIMNLDVYFTPDTNGQLVSVIDEMASKFSKSLKFGNFLLCYVTKCSYAVKAHMAQLIDATEKTNTIATKSILSKIKCLA